MFSDTNGRIKQLKRGRNRRQGSCSPFTRGEIGSLIRQKSTHRGMTFREKGGRKEARLRSGGVRKDLRQIGRLYSSEMAREKGGRAKRYRGGTREIERASAVKMND